jgi:hypothetical protein
MTANRSLAALVLLVAGCGPSAPAPGSEAIVAQAEPPVVQAEAPVTPVAQPTDDVSPQATAAGDPVEGWHEKTLCEPGENVLWSCRAKARTISVCASRTLTPTQGYIQYRAGQPGALELQYPASRVHPRGLFTYSLYIQGNTSLSFTNNGYTYSLVDDLRSAEDQVIVSQGDRDISTITCNSGGGFNIQRPDLLGIAATPYGN